MTSKALSERWRTDEGQALAEEVLARLMAGRPMDGLPLGQHEGRVDLRGLPAPIPRRLQRFEAAGWFVERLGDLVRFDGVTLKALDLSGAHLQSFRFHNTTIVGCRFDQANCQDWRMWATDVADCSFVGASLRDAAVGTSWSNGRQNNWRRVSFLGADCRFGVTHEAVFQACDFSGAKLDKVEFRQCTLVRCRFAGKLTGVLFDGRDLEKRPAPPPMEEVDFSEATFDEVEFQGFTLEDVTLPPDPDIRLVRRARCVARRALEILEGEEGLLARRVRAQFDRDLRGPGSEEAAVIFNRHDHMKWGGSELASLAEEVRDRAQRECDQR